MMCLIVSRRTTYTEIALVQMVSEFLGDGARHRPTVPQTFNMASLLNELQASPAPHHPLPEQQAQAHHGPAIHNGEAMLNG